MLGPGYLSSADRTKSIRCFSQDGIADHHCGVSLHSMDDLFVFLILFPSLIVTHFNRDELLNMRGLSPLSATFHQPRKFFGDFGQRGRSSLKEFPGDTNAIWVKRTRALIKLRQRGINTALPAIQLSVPCASVKPGSLTTSQTVRSS